MRRLYLIRHAKSDWDSPAGGDHERPLAPRGVKAAKLMGRFLAAAGQAPDAVVTSSALRARTTVELMAEAGGWTCPVRVTRSLYDGGPEGALAEIRRQGDDAGSLLAAGHEPTWSTLVETLCGGRVKMVTAALARIDFAVERWADIEPGAGALVWMVPPKLLQAAGWPS